MTLEITWPAVALLKLAPVGSVDPQVFGLQWRDPAHDWTPDRAARLDVVDSGRLALLGAAIAQLAPLVASDRRKVLHGALGRIRGALAGQACAIRITVVS